MSFYEKEVWHKASPDPEWEKRCDCLYSLYRVQVGLLESWNTDGNLWHYKGIFYWLVAGKLLKLLNFSRHKFSLKDNFAASLYWNESCMVAYSKQLEPVCLHAMGCSRLRSFQSSLFCIFSTDFAFLFPSHFPGFFKNDSPLFKRAIKLTSFACSTIT